MPTNKKTAKKSSKKRPSTDRERHVVDIDTNRLDEEWMSHSALYQDYASQLADAQYAMDMAKTEKDTVEAELDAAIRADPSAYGLEKVTEEGVKKTIQLQSELQIAVQSLHSTTRTVRLLQATVRALDHRKSALENLVRLYLSNYFGDPTLRRRTDNDDDLDQRLQERSDRVTRSNARRKKRGTRT